MASQYGIAALHLSESCNSEMIPRFLESLCTHVANRVLTASVVMVMMMMIVKSVTLETNASTVTNCGSGFGGLEVACWPLLPKFAGSNPAEAFGFFRA